MKNLLLILIFALSANAQVPFVNFFGTTTPSGCTGADITFVAAGTAASGTSTCTPTYPAGLVSGDKILIAVAAHNADVVSIPGFSYLYGGGATSGAEGENSGTGKIEVWEKNSNGTETGTVTVTVSGANTVTAQMVAYRSVTGTFDRDETSGSEAAAGTSWSVTGIEVLPVEACDWVMAATGFNGADGTPQHTVSTLTETGVTFTGSTERYDAGTTLGNNAHLIIADFVATAGSGSAAPGYTFTTASSGATWPVGGTVFVRLRPGAPTVFTDDFTRFVTSTDIDTDALWERVRSDMEGISGAVESNGPTTVTAARYVGTPALAANQYAEITFKTLASAGFIGPAVRFQPGAAASWYGCYADQSTLYVGQVVGSTWSDVTSVSKSYVAGNKLRIEATGAGTATRLTVKENTGSGWVNVFTDLNPSSDLDGGTPGINGYDAGTGITAAEDWKAGNL